MTVVELGIERREPEDNLGPFTPACVEFVVERLLAGDSLMKVARKARESGMTTLSPFTLHRHFVQNGTPLLTQVYHSIMALRAEERLEQLEELAVQTKSMDKDEVPAATLRYKALVTIMEKQDPYRFGKKDDVDQAIKEHVRRYVVQAPPKESGPASD